MDIILYLASPRTSTCAQQKFLGAHQRLVRDGFSLRRISTDRPDAPSIRKLIAFWNARGVIVDCGGQRPLVTERSLKGTSVVYLDMAREFESPQKNSVSYDIRSTCHMAARELLSLECAAYGYVGYGRGTPWSEERKRIFIRALNLNGHAVGTFDLDPNRHSPSVFYRKLIAWLRKAKMPLGIFAADDAYAMHLYDVVRKLNLRIPADVAILGVDDESDMLTVPGISSIQLDFRKAGNLAAELLLESIADPGRPHENLHFGPVQLLRRSSTRKILRPNESMETILRRIHDETPRGLTAAEVATWMTGSRRLAEMRFKAATGRSILEEITVARIDRAKELLANVDNPIGEIAELCGYKTPNAFRNAFKASTKLTPRDWRKRK